MPSDETPDQLAIRELITRWHAATAAGDVDTVLSFIAEDAIFLVAGKPPMRGRAAFESGLRGLLKTHRIQSTGDVQEIEVSGNLGYSRVELKVTVIPLAGGAPVTRTGSAMSILRKRADGTWVLVRDANLLA